MPLPTIDDYIASAPEGTRHHLRKIRALVKKCVPKATETLAYGLPTFRLHGNLVHFGGFKKHIGFYPTPSAIKAFKKELQPYKSSKGSVQFPIEQPLPFELIEKIICFRVAEQMAAIKK